MKQIDMKTVIRRALLAITCAAALTCPMLAQDTTTPPPQQQDHGGYGNRGAEMQQRQLEHLTKALSLTPDQVTQVKAIQADGQQQMMAARQDTSIQGPDRRAKMMSIREAEQTKIKALLTTDQQAKYDAMQAKQRERREEHQGNGQNPPPPPPAA